MRRIFKNGFRQRGCQRCGRRSDHGSTVADPNTTPGKCPVSLEVYSALQNFARAEGRTWRAKLRELWTQGKDSGDLRVARNVIGPSSRLDKVGRSFKTGPEKPKALRKRLGEVALTSGGPCDRCGEETPRDGVCQRPHEEEAS